MPSAYLLQEVGRWPERTEYHPVFMQRREHLENEDTGDLRDGRYFYNILGERYRLDILEGEQIRLTVNGHQPSWGVEGAQHQISGPWPLRG